MLLKRKGFPEENELVMCTVTSVQYHSVFAKLDEFVDKSGMIHISEVAPGRIRNMREYVQEGKKVVCKILKVDRERNRIDLSLRRVNDSQKREKNAQIKKEQQAEKILEYFAKTQKLEFRPLYTAVTQALFDESQDAHYVYLADAFDDVVNQGLDLTEQGINKKIATPLMELIRTRIKPPEVEIEGVLGVSSYAPDGIDLVRKSLIALRDAAENLTVAYKGGGKYIVRVKGPDYRTAEKTLQGAMDTFNKFAKKNKLGSSFERAKA